MTDTLRHSIDLPDGAMPMTVVEVVEYLDPETGRRAYAYRHAGSSALSTVLGLLDLAKHNLIGAANFD